MLNERLVYVIDDDSAVRDSMLFFLPTIGYSSRAFASGATMLASLPTLCPGCVMLDIRMPEMDGFDVIEALMPRRAEFPVVVVTGHGDVATAVRAMKLGASDFIEKPFDEDALIGILERLFADLVVTRHQDDKRALANARLTGRENDVLRGLIAGQSNKALAHVLGLSVRTVEMHRANMIKRLEVGTLAEALRLAFDAGTDPALELPVRADRG